MVNAKVTLTNVNTGGRQEIFVSAGNIGSVSDYAERQASAYGATSIQITPIALDKIRGLDFDMVIIDEVHNAVANG